MSTFQWWIHLIFWTRDHKCFNFCGNKKTIFLTGSWDISRCVRGVFKETSGHLQPYSCRKRRIFFNGKSGNLKLCLWQQKQVKLSPNSNQVDFVPEPNRSWAVLSDKRSEVEEKASKYRCLIIILVIGYAPFTYHSSTSCLTMIIC